MDEYQANVHKIEGFLRQNISSNVVASYVKVCVTNKMWRRYFVPNTADWWAPLYPPDNFKRPTAPLCDGCHSVNYDIATKTVSEWNVGCERCHGPGSAHVEHPVRSMLARSKLSFSPSAPYVPPARPRAYRMPFSTMASPTDGSLSCRARHSRHPKGLVPSVSPTARF